MAKSRVIVGALLALGGLWTGFAAPADAERSAGRQARRVTSKEAKRIELGRRLFFDPLVSQTGTTSCASCHDPDHGFSDPKQFSSDERGATPRHSQVILDTGHNPSAHWDGEFASIDELVTARMTRVAVYYGAPTTPGLPSRPTTPTAPGRARSGGARAPGGAPSVTLTGPNGRPLVPGPNGLFPSAPTSITVRVPPARRAGGFTNNVPQVLEDSGRYAEAFKAAFGSRNITIEKLARAMESYCHSIESTEAPFDRYQAGDENALSAAQKRGLELFNGRAGCAACHKSKGNHPLFTDFKARNTGVAYLEMNELTGQGADVGRMRLTSNASDLRSFKTPTLRDVTRRGPYMHNGRFKTLEQVVRFYASGCGTDGSRSKIVTDGFSATAQDVRDLVAFLGALTGDERPGLAKSAWKARAKMTKLRFLDGSGKPIEDLPVTLAPFGDVIPVEGADSPDGADRVVVTRELTTDRSGWIEFEPCATTHTRVVLPGGIEPQHGPIFPDTCRKQFVKLPVHGRTRLVVVMPLDVEAPATLYVPDPRSGTSTVLRGGIRFTVTTGDPAGVPYFQRIGVVDVGDQRIARYEGWLRIDMPNPVDLMLPAAAGKEHEVRTIELDVEQEQRIYVVEPDTKAKK